MTIERGVLGNVEDAYVSPGNGSWAAGAYPFMWTGGATRWSLYRFDLSPIPAGAQVALGVFSVNVAWNQSSSTVMAHRVLTPWSEATVTWPSFGSAANWAPAVEGTFDPIGYGDKIFDATALVQGWVGGSHPNYGLLLEEAGALHGYYTSESSNEGSRPRLYVCYLAGGPCAGAPNGAPCDDGNACSLGETCQNGQCGGGSTFPCDPLDACHDAGICDPATGVCSDPPKADGMPCDDGNACTAIDVCSDGACSGPILGCDDGNACTADTCDAAQGCLHTPASCSDGNACTVDTCNPATGCSHSPITCSAADACHVGGACDPATGMCSNPAKLDGSPCNDGDACTQSDTCQAGQCAPGQGVVCPPSDQCHVAGSCDAATGQCADLPKPNGSPCNDGNACTLIDVCQAGQCNGGAAVVCLTSGDACHGAGTCDPGTGQCVDPLFDDGTPCGPNAACRSGACTQASLAIKVFDEAGQPIAGAHVTSGNQVLTTNDLGEAFVSSIPTSEVVAKVEASKRSTSVVRRAVSPGASLDDNVTLTWLGAPMAIDPLTGGSATRGKVRVTFDPGDVVNANQLPPSTPYGVTILPVDPATANLAVIPAPLDGVLEDGTSTPLTSIFMTEISLTAEGQPLHIAPGHTASVEIMLPDSVQSSFSAGDTIDAWWLDTSLGKWRREGSGMLAPSQADPGKLAWVGEVSHFTWWNVGGVLNAAERSCVTVEIFDENNQPITSDVTLRTVGLDYDIYPPGTSLLSGDLFGGTACLDIKAQGNKARILAEKPNYYVSGVTYCSQDGATCGAVPDGLLVDSFDYAVGVFSGFPVVAGNVPLGTSCQTDAKCLGMKIIMSSRACVSSMVTQSSSPVEGATVTAKYDTGLRSVSTETLTGADGRFCVEGSVGSPIEIRAAKGNKTSNDLVVPVTSNAQFCGPGVPLENDPSNGGCNQVGAPLELSIDSGPLQAMDFHSLGANHAADVVATSTGDLVLGSNFDLTWAFPGIGQFVSQGQADALLLKITNPAQDLLPIARFAGTQRQEITSVAIDAFDNIIVTGIFYGTMSILEQDTTFNAGTLNATYTSQGLADGFIAKFDASGNYLWSARLPGAGVQAPQSVEVLPGDGSIVLTGNFENTVQYSLNGAPAAPLCGDCDINGCPQACTATGTDIFLVRLSPSGEPMWGRSYGSAQTQRVLAMTTSPADPTEPADHTDRIYLAGQFLGSLTFDTPMTANVDGYYDGFVASIDENGDPKWSDQIGGPKDQIATAITAGAQVRDGGSGVIVGGEFSGVIPPPVPGSLLPAVLSFSQDTFLAVYDPQYLATYVPGTDTRRLKLSSYGDSATAQHLTALQAFGADLLIAGSATEKTVDFGVPLSRVGNEDLYFGKISLVNGHWIHSWSRRAGDLGAAPNLGTGSIFGGALTLANDRAWLACSYSRPTGGGAFEFSPASSMDIVASTDGSADVTLVEIQP